MLKIVILGTGNLAKHLYTAFTKADDVDVVQIVGRNQKDLEQFSEHSSISNNYDAIADADAYLIAVKDDAITEVSQHLLKKKGIVAHTSGAIHLNAIQPKNRGVFYPLQTFTKGKTVDFRSIPICVEAEKKESLKSLRKLADSLSENVHHIDSEQRKKLHLAAVFVNNFTNYLYGIGEELCLENGLSFDLLKPLILETAEKIRTMSPKAAQTGPARRNDKKSMKSHLELLNNKEHITIYKLLSQAIKQAHEKNYKELLSNITTFVFDVDGVFTDGSVLITTDGELLRKMSVKDGYALKTAIKKGYNVCIITGGTNHGVKERLKGLGVTDFYMGAHHKQEPLEEYLDIHDIKPESVVYMGDDMPDIPPMKMVALATSPQNAVPEVKAISDYVSHKNGGDGCVRDIIEQVLKVRGDWNDNFSAKND